MDIYEKLSATEKTAMSGTLDRMAPDGRWYSSTNSAEAEEPVGVIVPVETVDPSLPESLRTMWKAYFRGQIIDSHFANVRYPLCVSARHARLLVNYAQLDDANATTQRQIDQLTAIAEGPFATVPLPLLPTGPFQKEQDDDRG